MEFRPDRWTSKDLRNNAEALERAKEQADAGDKGSILDKLSLRDRGGN